MNKQTLISIIVIVVAVVGGLIVLQSSSNKTAGKPGQYDTLAQCLGEKGATFYGAFWCPHCNNQKKMFGDSAKLLPYTECSTPDGRGQTEACIAAGIQSYPTWVFADGTRLTGEQTPADLAAKVGCEATLPGNSDEVVAPAEGESSTAITE